MAKNYHKNSVLSIENSSISLLLDMLESLPYVWKIEKYGDEESSSVADEKCTRRPAANDYGNDGKETRIIPENCG